MIDALISGKLIKDTELKTGQSGKAFCQFVLSVPLHNEPENVIISGMAFGETAQRVAKLGKGDALSAIGSLKPTEWQDKTTGETRHGLSLTVSNVLTPYDIKKKRNPMGNGTPQHQNHDRQYGDYQPFDDGIGF